MRALRWWWIGVLLPACQGHRAEPVGATSQGFITDLFVIGNIRIEPGTYHWADPSLLLDTAEGAGPRSLNVSVSAAVSPLVSYTGTRTPSRSEISDALGWSVQKTVQLTSDSTVLVPVNAYARVDAYPAFQRITWSLLGPGNGAAVLGNGAVYKPIGIYFDTCGCIGPDPCGTGCVRGFPDGLYGTGGSTGTGSTGTGGSTGAGGAATVGDAGAKPGDGG